jgi:peptidoglycan/xylan/chitin deacetylase (PgdA/CDA1 family)
LHALIERYRLWEQQPRNEPPPLGVTFDDGSLDNYEHARPVLDRLGLKASFYIPSGLVDEQRCPWHDRLGFALLKSVAMLRKSPGHRFRSPAFAVALSSATFAAVLPNDAIRPRGGGCGSGQAPFAGRARACVSMRWSRRSVADVVPDWAGLMSWAQIRELREQGHEIGSHSLSHPLLPDLDSAALREEVVTSRLRILAAAGGEVASFCYPNGSYDTRAVEGRAGGGYACAVTTSWGLNRVARPSSSSVATWTTRAAESPRRVLRATLVAAAQRFFSPASVAEPRAEHYRTLNRQDAEGAKIVPRHNLGAHLDTMASLVSWRFFKLWIRPVAPNARGTRTRQFLEKTNKRSKSPDSSRSLLQRKAAARARSSLVGCGTHWPSSGSTSPCEVAERADEGLPASHVQHVQHDRAAPVRLPSSSSGGLSCAPGAAASLRAKSSALPRDRHSRPRGVAPLGAGTAEPRHQHRAGARCNYFFLRRSPSAGAPTVARMCAEQDQIARALALASAGIPQRRRNNTSGWLCEG